MCVYVCVGFVCVSQKVHMYGDGWMLLKLSAMGYTLGHPHGLNKSRSIEDGPNMGAETMDQHICRESLIF